MRVIVGDVIGTTDGRYGEVVEVGNSLVTVRSAVAPDEPCPENVSYFVVGKNEVASIV